MLDKIKLFIAVLMVAAGVAGFYALGERPLVLRILALLAGFVAAAIVAWFSQPGKDFVQFARESWAEAKRVVWPTGKEALQTTGIVFALVAVVAIFLWAVDFLLNIAVSKFVG